MSDFRTATEAELQRDAERIRRAKQAQENHKRAPRTHAAKVRDALNHVYISKKTPAPSQADTGVTGVCRDEDDSAKNTTSGM